MDARVLRGFIMAISAAILWGLSGVSGQFLFQQRGVNVEWLITIRLLISGFCLLAFSRFGEKQDIFSIWQNKADAIQLLVFSILGMSAVQYTFFAAIKHSNAATATVMQYSGPIMIAVFLAIKYKRLPKITEFIAIIMAVAGTFLLVTHGNINTLSISGIALFFGLASAVTLAIYTLQPMGLLAKYNSSLIIGWGMFCGGVVFSFVKAPWQVEGYWDFQTYLFTSFVILLGALLAFYIYMSSVKILGGQKASLLASAEPLAATLLAVFWLGVPFSTIDWIGSLCIVSTVFLLSKSEAVGA